MAVIFCNWEEPPPVSCRGGALAIGNFDGVHRGHQALLRELGRKAEPLGGPAVVLTFDPHPLQLLRPERFQPVLTAVADRAELIQSYGAEHVVVLRTNPGLLQLAPEAFFARVLESGFQPRAMVEGSNFTFGKDRAGTVETLKSLCAGAGIAFDVVPPLQHEGATVSSSRVRSAVNRGVVREAALLLGRPYRLAGTVGVGQRRGQKIGFPTANLEQIGVLVPADGVYAVRAQLQGAGWPAAVNIGPNPTFGEQARKVEVHLIGFQGDLYGQSVAIDFIERLRDTRPFPGVADLVAQLQRDVEAARQLAGE